MAIRFNNNADFFHANHDWYKNAVREPSLALAEALAPVIEEIDDAFERRPNRVVSRINRDIRFSNDKSPYRDYLWLSFRRPKEDRERHGIPGFYMDIGVSGSSYGMGFYWPNKPLLNALRRRMTLEPDALTAILEPIEEQFTLHGDFYKRMPVPEFPQSISCSGAVGCMPVPVSVKFCGVSPGVTFAPSCCMARSVFRQSSLHR
jgi:uncharacterized protein (TIGR02453 family)